jgi:hypothetical protein
VKLHSGDGLMNEDIVLAQGIVFFIAGFETRYHV